MNRKIDRGFLGIEAGGVLLVVILAVIIAVATLGTLFSRQDVNTEISNVQQIMSTTKGLMKQAGSYNFTSSAKMTGALIQSGGMPNSITLNGEKQSGTATAVNIWGGDIIVSPEKVGGSTNNKGFSLTYKNVPQNACITLAAKLSGSAAVDETSISGTNNIGAVDTEKAGTQCKPDNGSVGVNTLIFKSNS